MSFSLTLFIFYFYYTVNFEQPTENVVLVLQVTASISLLIPKSINNNADALANNVQYFSSEASVNVLTIISVWKVNAG